MPEPSEYELAELRDELAALALTIASDLGQRLDYSLRSVKRVERALAALHRTHKRTGEDDGLYGMALEFGAYLIKVIERHYEPGVWERDHPDFGEEAFPYFWDGGTIFPVAWCLRRIFDGPGDNVWVKFRAIVMGKG